MTSAIDATKPTEGQAYTADVRANFQAAASEISTLQGSIATLQSQLAGLQADLATAQGDIVTLKARQMAAANVITANPPNIGSAVYVAATDAVPFTPLYTTRAIVIVDGQLGNTSNASESQLQLYVGNGDPPPAGTLMSATNGQELSAPTSMLSSRAGDYDPFAVAGLVTGLQPQTPYWIGVGLRALSGTATLSELSVLVFAILDPLP